MIVPREISPILVIAHRDLVKLLRDRGRLVATLVFPFVFIGALGGAMQASIGQAMGFNYLAFIFTGVLIQTMFQTAALGLISLIEDREQDFSQEVFISPISRYTIVFGKIIGETLVALPQGVAVMLFGLVLAVPLDLRQVLGVALVAIVAAVYGGAFGVLVLSNLRSQRAAQQIFPFILLPQFFLAGVFNPITQLPWYLDLLSKLSPMRYPIDLARGLYYAGDPAYPHVVALDPLSNAAIIAGSFAVFMVVGTFLFVRSERNR